MHIKSFSLSKPQSSFLKSTRKLLLDGRETDNNISSDIGDISAQIKTAQGYLIVFVLDGGLDESSTSVAYLDDKCQLKDIKNIVGNRKFLIPIYNFKSIEIIGDENFLVSSWQENEGAKIISIMDDVIVLN